MRWLWVGDLLHALVIEQEAHHRARSTFQPLGSRLTGHDERLLEQLSNIAVAPEGEATSERGRFLSEST